VDGWLDGCIGEVDGLLDVCVGCLLDGDLLGLWRGLTARKLGLSALLWMVGWMDVLVRWMVCWMCALVVC